MCYVSLYPLHCFLFCIFIGCTCCCYLRENLENLCDFFSPFANDVVDVDFSVQSLGENDSEAQAGDGTKKYKNESRHKSHPKQEVTHELNAEILKWRIITRNEKRIRKEAKFRNIRDGPEVKWKKQAEMFKNTLTGAQKNYWGYIMSPTRHNQLKKERRRNFDENNFTSSCVWFHCLRFKICGFCGRAIRQLSLQDGNHRNCWQRA